MRAQNIVIQSILVVGGFVLVSLMIMHQPCFAQVTTADLEGKITGEKGRLLANVNIIVKNQETGIIRGTASAPNGRYRVPALKPGVYEITAKHLGYTSETKKDIELNVGQVINIGFQLTPTALALSDTIVVVAKAPLVETTESKIGIVVREAEIRNLPLNSRDVVELALLSSGVSARRSAQTPSFSPVNFGAQNNRATRVFVDGINMSNHHNGGILLAGDGVSQNAVAQFEVITNRFKAEYGNAAAGIINLVTKSGSNDFHGSLFGLFRDEALNATNHFDTSKPPFERQQFGFTFGGPLVRDRTHFFLASEQDREDAFAIVNTNGVFPELEETFVTPNRNSNFLAKLDHQLSANQWLTAKYARETNSSVLFTGGNLARSAGLKQSGTLNHLLFLYRWVPSNRLLAELRLGYVETGIELDPFGSGPHLVFPSVETGRFPFGEARQNENRWQLKGDISYLATNLWGEHNWKFGFDINRVKTSESLQQFSTGLFVFPSDTSSFPFVGIVGNGKSFFNLTNYKLGFHLQDDWSPIENLTFNLGWRYEIETDATNRHYVSTKTDPDLPFIIKGDRAIDKNNLAPRLGLAWDPLQDGKTVFRGGYGIFYSRIESQYASGEVSSDQRNIYTIFNPGTTNVEEIDLEGLPYRVEFLLPEKVPTPYSRHFTVGVSRQLANDFALDLDYVNARGFHDIFIRNDVNPLDPATFTRPLPQYQEVFVTRTDGRSFYDALQIILRKRWSRNYQFRASYTLSKAENDFDDILFGLLFKRGPAGWDERHRFTFDGQVLLPWDVLLSGIVTLASGRPYNIFTGNDTNLNGDLTDDQPPGVSRNSERTEDFSDVDLRISKVFRYGKYNLELLGEVFNLFNHVNFDAKSYVGNQKSPNFGQPTVALAPRQVQLGIRFSF